MIFFINRLFDCCRGIQMPLPRDKIGLHCYLVQPQIGAVASISRSDTSQETPLAILCRKIELTSRLLAQCKGQRSLFE